MERCATESDYGMMSKKELRSLMRRRAALMSPDEEMRLSQSIWRQVEALGGFAAAKCVLIYMSLPGEVTSQQFIEKWAPAKRFAIPLVCGDGRLSLRQYDPALLQQGYRGILEPSIEAPVIQSGEIDFAIVPGVAFAAGGGGVIRLGRGGGYYDRLLPLLHCPKFGVAYSFRLLESLPSDPWDAPLDGVVTERAPAGIF